MKRVNVAKLKAELSRYLRLVQKGEEVIVLDRKEPVARLVAMPRHETWWARLAAQGKCRLPTKKVVDFKPPKLRKRVPIEDILRTVGSDLELK